MAGSKTNEIKSISNRGWYPSVIGVTSVFVVALLFRVTHFSVSNIKCLTNYRLDGVTGGDEM